MTASDTITKFSLWLIAISLIIYHGSLAFLTFMPLEYWMKYHWVKPAVDFFPTDEDILFISKTDLHRDVILTFNDILYKYDEEAKTFARYDAQETHRLHNEADEDNTHNRLTPWPFKDGVRHEGVYCLESNIRFHLPLGVERSMRFDGCEAGHTFEAVDNGLEE